MRKIASLLLLVCMLFSLGVITACNRDKEENTEVKNQVTEQEWNAALAVSNFTINGFVTERGEQESLVMKVTDNLIFTQNDGHETFVIKQGDGWHFTDGTETGPVVNGVSASVDFAMRSFHMPAYSSFSYDEQTKSYVYINSENSGFHKFNVYFENGVIIKIEGCEDDETVTHTFNFSDYGTTVVEMLSSTNCH